LQEQNQISSDLKTELVDKLDEFTTYNDSLRKFLKIKEQIEKFLNFTNVCQNQLLKAVEEWLNSKSISTELRNRIMSV
jgi:hypothetical protein